MTLDKVLGDQHLMMLNIGLGGQHSMMLDIVLGDQHLMMVDTAKEVSITTSSPKILLVLLIAGSNTPQSHLRNKKFHFLTVQGDSPLWQ